VAPQAAGSEAPGVTIRIPEGLLGWMKRETKLGNPALKKALEETGDPDLKQALDWSVAVNESIEKMVRGVPPFPCVREVLERLGARADILVVSATPGEALAREWKSTSSTVHAGDLGQEVGTKKQMLRQAAKYTQGQSLMIATRWATTRPPRPTIRTSSPSTLGRGGKLEAVLRGRIDRFFCGAFAGKYQEELLADFNRYLPAQPPWPVEEG